MKECRHCQAGNTDVAFECHKCGHKFQPGEVAMAVARVPQKLKGTVMQKAAELVKILYEEGSANEFNSPVKVIGRVTPLHQRLEVGESLFNRILIHLAVLGMIDVSEDGSEAELTMAGIWTFEENRLSGSSGWLKAAAGFAVGAAAMGS